MDVVIGWLFLAAVLMVCSLTLDCPLVLDAVWPEVSSLCLMFCFTNFCLWPTLRKTHQGRWPPFITNTCIAHSQLYPRNKRNASTVKMLSTSGEIQHLNILPVFPYHLVKSATFRKQCVPGLSPADSIGSFRASET